jgi:hypothetical protein
MDANMSSAIDFTECASEVCTFNIFFYNYLLSLDMNKYKYTPHSGCVPDLEKKEKQLII